jgi:beta-lactamase regulating signal transducer with metallopeptidase domain
MHYNLDRVAGNFLTQLADASVRAVALAILVALLIIFLRRRPAAQHALWTLVAAGMLAMPLLRPMIPVARLPFAEPVALQAINLGPDRLVTNSDGSPSSVSLVQPRPSALHLGLRSYFAIAYLTGVLIFASRLILGIFLTRRVLREARSIVPELETNFAELVHAGVDIQESDRVIIPVATGVTRMRVVLPTEWRDWPSSKVRAVLAHELAHARRRDPVVALLAAINQCVFWFHPLAWWLEQRLAVLAEHAADDVGMAVSSDAESYARTVVEIASHMQRSPHRLVWNSTSMSGPLVARRVRRILDSRTVKSVQRMGGLARVVLASSAALLLWITAAARFQEVARAQVRPPGVPGTLANIAPHGDEPSATKFEIADLNFEGDPRLTSAEQIQVAASLTERTYTGKLDDVEEEILERIRAAWQDRGHFKVVVTGNARVLTSSPGTARIAVTAHVDGGEQYLLGGITFKHNQGISDTKTLRALFPLKDRDIFSRAAIAHGLENLRNTYVEFGYINFTAVPDTRFDDEKRLAYLDINLDEGKQFSISSITFLGADERDLSGLLHLKAGDIYNQRLVAVFFKEHGDLLPAGSSVDSNVHLQRDETAATVAVTFDFRQHSVQ